MILYTFLRDLTRPAFNIIFFKMTEIQLHSISKSINRGVALTKWIKQKPKNWMLQNMGTTELKSVNNVPKWAVTKWSNQNDLNTTHLILFSWPNTSRKSWTKVIWTQLSWKIAPFITMEPKSFRVFLILQFHEIFSHLSF